MAAEKLLETIKHDYLVIANVVVRIYVNVEELARRHRNAGIVLHPRRMHRFICGFEGFDYSIHIEDTSAQRMVEASRLRQSYAIFLDEPNCRRTLLVCDKQNTRRILGRYRLDNATVNRTSFLASTDPMEGGALKSYRKTRIESVFQNPLLYSGRDLRTPTTLSPPT